MGKSNSLLGVVTGKVGSVVGYKLAGKDKQGVRAYVSKVLNPKTRGQRNQRAIFATIQTAASGLSEIINHSFEGKKGAVANRGRFTSLNQSVLVTRKTDFVAKGFKRIALNPWKISEGTLPKVTVSFDSSLSNKHLFLTDLQYTDLATATPDNVFPVYKAGVQLTFVTSLVQSARVSSIDKYFLVDSNYAKFGRVAFKPGSTEKCFVAADAEALLAVDPRSEWDGCFTINPAAVNQDLSQGWEDLIFRVKDGKLYVGYDVRKFNALTFPSDGESYDPSKGLLISGAAVIMSERSASSYKYSSASMYYLGEMVAKTPVEGYDIGMSMDAAEGSYGNVGESANYPSDKYLNNADNKA